MRFMFDNHIAGDHITSFVDSKIQNFSNPKLYLACVVTICCKCQQVSPLRLAGLQKTPSFLFMRC